MNSTLLVLITKFCHTSTLANASGRRKSRGYKSKLRPIKVFCELTIANSGEANMDIREITLK